MGKGELPSLLKAASKSCSDPEQEPKSNELPSPTWKLGETGGGDGLTHCLLVCAAVGFLAGAPCAPHLVAEPLRHLAPVPAAHQAGRIDLITAAGYGAEAYGQRQACRLAARSSAATAW
jgi:hypothetical protein